MKAIILENIRSLNNVGAIFRTADGAGFDRVVCVWYTPTPPRKEISKTALGAENFVAWEYYETVEDAVHTYQNLGCTIVVLEKNNKSTSLTELQIEPKNVCLIAGNELEWVSKKAQEMADHICHLPMLGKKESLNVAVATGIALYMLL
jgi:tRNA G18 (ribose-2'-O)-methylase SpoU